MVRCTATDIGIELKSKLVLLSVLSFQQNGGHSQIDNRMKQQNEMYHTMKTIKTVGIANNHKILSHTFKTTIYYTYQL